MFHECSIDFRPMDTTFKITYEVLPSYFFEKRRSPNNRKTIMICMFTLQLALSCQKQDSIKILQYTILPIQIKTCEIHSKFRHLLRNHSLITTDIV